MILFLLLATIPLDVVATDRVDLIETSFVYDGEGIEIFRQQIFHDWHNGEHRVIAWKMLKHERERPQFDYAAGEYRALFLDHGTIREVRAGTARESHCQHDPECENRKVWELGTRRGLRKQ